MRTGAPFGVHLFAASALAMVAGPAGAVPLPVPRPAEFAVPVVRPGVDVPLPVPRPETGPPLPPAAQAPEVLGPTLPPPAPPAPPEPDLACAPLLGGGKVVAHPARPVAAPDGCGIAAPVMLDAVVLRNGRHVVLEPPALMRCDFAERLADWLRDDVAPAATAEGDLLGVADAAAYVCRSRNWTAGARLSEHARGNAIDILAFRFTRRSVGMRTAEAGDLLARLKASACARFSTVLGPGSDAYHATDLHLDLERRRNGFKLCQWDVP